MVALLVLIVLIVMVVVMVVMTVFAAVAAKLLLRSTVGPEADDPEFSNQLASHH